MNLLMHTCCGPCSVYCIDALREEGIEPTAYWYNPNIHPYAEYKKRMETLRNYTKSINVKTIFNDYYGLDEFTKNAICNLENRCQRYCYRTRLEDTAKFASKNGYDTITTTLLVSPYQKHEVLKVQGEGLAKKYGLNFLYRDFRVGFKQGYDKARALGMYIQKYCGCIFSEEDRYLYDKPQKKNKEEAENKAQNEFDELKEKEKIKKKQELAKRKAELKARFKAEYHPEREEIVQKRIIARMNGQKLESIISKPREIIKDN